MQVRAGLINRLQWGYKSMFYFLAFPLQYTKAYYSASRNGGDKGQKENNMEAEKAEVTCEEPRILEEIQVEELAIDGICGVY